MQKANEVASLALRGKDLVVFSVDWDGDPLSKMHIMRILAKENRVLWVNSLGNRAPKANAHDLQRIWQKLRRFSEGLREVEKNLFVLSPLAIPWFGSPQIQALNGFLVRAQVQRAMRALDMHKVISWSYLPASAPVSGTLGEELVIYQCVDEFSAFSDTQADHIAELEKRLLLRSDLVIASAERLVQNKQKLNPNTVLVRHGVDFSHFVKATDPTTQVPPDIQNLPKPIFGFFGLIADWVDLGAMAAVARAHPEGTVVLLGKVSAGVDVTELASLSNVRFLGRKSYADLPGYCKAFDVALMPFKLNELTLNANPLKVREYLAAGLPVVSTDIPEVRAVGQCRIARDTADFVRQVDAALAEGGGPKRIRAEKIFPESWEARVEEIRGHVERAMAQKGLT